MSRAERVKALLRAAFCFGVSGYLAFIIWSSVQEPASSWLSAIDLVFNVVAGGVLLAFAADYFVKATKE